MDDCCNRMLVGGPRDGQIVWVHKDMPPFQVHVFAPAPSIETWADIIAVDDPAMVAVKTGWYYRDEFADNLIGLHKLHRYYRWQDMRPRNSAKVYMRRMGKSLYEIYNHVEWETWGA